MSAPGKGDTVFLVDGSSFVFRAYFQSMNQDRKYNYRAADNLPTGAVRLFCNKIYQFIKDGAADVSPTHLAIIFDKAEHSFRNELYADYKANRSAPPDDLIPQFPLMRSAVEDGEVHVICSIHGAAVEVGGASSGGRPPSASPSTARSE